VAVEAFKIEGGEDEGGQADLGLLNYPPKQFFDGLRVRMSAVLGDEGG